jgi:two-component system, LytTR family, sensor kinase
MSAAKPCLYFEYVIQIDDHGRLGELLRASIGRDFEAEVPFEAELALTQAYLDVEAVRFADRLTVHMDIPEGAKKALVPPLLLQPIVENAIQHGLSTKGGGRIEIQSAVESNRLILSVRDDGAGTLVELPNNGKFGIGLSSTQKRLEGMYPESHFFEIRRLDTGGTEVRIAIPFRISGPATKEDKNELTALADC